MTTAMVICTQWGDEGKGKIVDYFATRDDVVAPSHRGHNSGPTILTSAQPFSFLLLPYRPQTTTQH